MKMIKLHKSLVYEFTYNEVMCEIHEDPDCRLFLPYVKEKWTEDKESNLFDAIDSCLKYLGVPLKERLQIKFTIV